MPEVENGLLEVVRSAARRIVQLLDEQPVLIELAVLVPRDHTPLGAVMAASEMTQSHVVRYVRRTKTVNLLVARGVDDPNAIVRARLTVKCPADAYLTGGGKQFQRALTVEVPVGGFMVTVGRGEFG